MPPGNQGIGLFSEGNFAGLGVHALDDGKGLERIAQVADDLSAGLEALFDGDADALDLGACGLAPVVTVNDQVHSKMTPETMIELLKQLEKEAEDDE